MADTTVTGRIGDMDVALINAASEATLQKLLEQMSALSSKMGGSGGAGGQQSQATAVTNTTTTFNKAGQAVGAFAGAVADATKGLLNFAGNLIGGTFLALKNLTTELFLGGTRVTDFTKHLAALPSIFGTLGSVVHTVAQFFQNGVETFRSLSQVGAGFTGSLTDMRIMAAESGMTLERFSKTVIDNAEKMALFGSSVSSGAQRFGKLSKDLRESEAGKRLMNMGFSIDEINETLITYAGINARMGRDRARGDTEIIARAAEFGEALSQAAAATGLSRKEIGNVADTLSKDIVIGAMSRRFAPGKERDEFMAGIAALTGKFKEGGGMFLEAASGFMKSPQILALRTMSNQFVTIPQQFAKGQLSYIDAQNAMTDEARKQLERLEKDPMYLKSMESVPGFEAAHRALKEYAATARISAAEVAEQVKRQRESKQVDELFKTFDNLIETFRATFALKFLQSEAFKDFEAVINGVLGKTPGFGNVLDSLVDVFEKVLRGVSQFISDWQRAGFVNALKINLTSMLQDMFDIPEELLKGLSAEDRLSKAFDILMSRAGVYLAPALESLGKSIWNGISTAMITGIKSLWENNQLVMIVGGAIAALFVGKKLLGGGGGDSSGAAKPFSPLQSLGNSIAGAAGILLNGVAIGASMIVIGKGLEFLAVGVKAFEGVSADALISAGAGLAAITTAIKVFAAMGPALANPAAIAGIVIVEAAIAGLGLALRLFPADLIRAFGDAIQSTFAGMSGILESTGAAIGKVVDSITNMKTATMAATTQQIKDLSNIPARNIEIAAEAIGKLKIALDGFAPGMFRGFSEMVGGIFASDKVGPLEKMAELGPRLATAAPGFSAFRDAMGAGFSVTGLSLTPQQSNSIALMTRDLPAYAAGLGAVTKLAPNIQSTADAMQAFVAASKDVNLDKFTFSKEQSASLVDGTNKLKNLAAQLSNASKEFKKLDDTGLAKIKEGVEGLSKAFKDFNESFIEKFLPKFEQMKSTTQEGLLTEVGSKLDSLNTSMTALVGIERDSRGFLNTISTKRPGKIS